jgi:hypothetical protein
VPSAIRGCTSRAHSDVSRSQEQLSKILQLVLDSDTLKSGGGPNSRTARLGTEGQKVLEDTKSVLRSLKAWGEEKNGNDLLQNFFVRLACIG